MKKTIFFLALLLLIAGCSHPQPKGGIIFTFDSGDPVLWAKSRDLFNKYEIKATFFIVNPAVLSEAQISALRVLQGDGHEIACNGMKRIDARTYWGSAANFFKDEAEPAINSLNQMGFKVVSYAYSYGLAPDSVDNLMLQHVRYLRKATWNMNNTLIENYDNIFAKTDSFNIVTGMNIDGNYYLEPTNIESGIIRAQNKNQVLVLRANTIDNSGSDFTISPAYLEQVFKLCRKDNVKSIRMQDLGEFFGHKDEVSR